MFRCVTCRSADRPLIPTAGVNFAAYKMPYVNITLSCRRKYSSPHKKITSNVSFEVIFGTPSGARTPDTLIKSFAPPSKIQLFAIISEVIKAAKKNKSKWNRAHEFSKRKPTKSTKGHPAYIFAKNGRVRKYFAFTHSATTDGKDNIRLKKNIDITDKKDCYIRQIPLQARDDEFEKPSKEYKFRTKADAELVKALQKQKSKKKQ